MASYKSGFDPPTRPEDSVRARRHGGYMAPTIRSQSRSESRERGNDYNTGLHPSRRLQTSDEKPQPTVLSRTRIRDPSPSINQISDAKSNKPSFNFGRGTTKTTITAQPRQLQGKTSRNVLRRKPSSIAKQPPPTIEPPPVPSLDKQRSVSPSRSMGRRTEGRPSIEASLEANEFYNEIYTRPRARVPRDDSPRIIPELDRYRDRLEQTQVYSGRNPEIPKLATQNLPLATPISPESSVISGFGGLSSNPNRYSGYSGSGYSASPSTRFSESPGPGGAYSRDTTPTSMSSQSPGIMAPSKTTTPRVKQGITIISNRPPVTRRRGSSFNENEGLVVDSQGLPALRESLNSSSSNSTVKGDAVPKDAKKKKRMSPVPPSPPPRKSSQKFKKERTVEDSPTRPAKTPAQSTLMSTVSPVKTRKLLPENQTQPPPQSQAQTRSPPVRPSREGTPQLQPDTINVIQSNLTGINFPHNKRQSALPRGASPQLAQGARISSRNPSPSPILHSQRQGTPAPGGLGIIPNLKPPQEQHPANRPPATRTPSPSVANSKSRFGLFGRRTKTAPEVPTVDKEKVVRKGPAAGTGHEGYGRYAGRGRSTSTSGTNRIRDRSMSGANSSRESLTNDPFLLERMSPVVIAGGGEIVESQNINRRDSNSSILSTSDLNAAAQAKPNSNTAVSRTTLWPSALPKETKRASTLAVKGRRPSGGNAGEMPQPSLAVRRSMQRLNNSTGTLNLPKPINIPGLGVSPSLNSMESSLMSDESQMEGMAELDRGRKGQLTKPRKLEKRTRSPGKLKWNFFHRSHPSDKEKAAIALPVAVGRAPVNTVPHYALLDSSDEQRESGEIDLEDILRDADVVDLTNEELDALQFGAYKENLRRIENLNTIMETGISIPERSPMIFSSPEPLGTPEVQQSIVASKQTSPAELVVPIAPGSVALPTDLHLTGQTAAVRPSRLAQVGRIPKVVSARPVATSPKSFSRPFARLSISSPAQQLPALDKESLAVGPSPPKPSTPEPQLPEGTLFGLGLRQDSVESTEHGDFLAFSPRKGSEATSSSGGISYLGTVAIIPDKKAPLAEDEVWNEYDDLMGEDKVPLSPTSSFGNPFQYESNNTHRLRQSQMQGLESPALPRVSELAREPLRRSALTSSSVYSTDMTQDIKDAFNDSLTVDPAPASPMSFSDFFSGYGDRGISTPGDSAHKPLRSSKGSRKSNASSNHNRLETGLVTVTEKESISPISQVNLRVGSMTVSKWLTFGHVLFSPAREELMQLEGSTKRHSILVIDGLGNDDWSFYASETYPAATFYNLSPTRPLSQEQRTSGPALPPNHRQIQYPSPTSKFPFPSSTFHVVVFRFPVAMSAASYANIVAESKRVLKPGGYLELAILDLDMLNMGNRARRAVRGLKVQMQIANPSIELASASDAVLKLVGKRGFKDIKSCNVGVPVASLPTHSQSEEVSLASMLQDESEAADEGINKMVAKVGRWWYKRCYETMVHPESEESLFDDMALLGECEKWRSSFKLVVAYAQKPVQGRRRTNSV